MPCLHEAPSCVRSFGIVIDSQHDSLDIKVGCEMSKMLVIVKLQSARQALKLDSTDLKVSCCERHDKAGLTICRLLLVLVLSNLEQCTKPKLGSAS